MTVKKVKAHSDMTANELLMCRNFNGLISGAYTQTVQFQVAPNMLSRVSWFSLL